MTENQLRSILTASPAAGGPLDGRIGRIFAYRPYRAGAHTRTCNAL
jgi:hypothetical protein